LPRYLIDTNVISELRKGSPANRGVRRFFDGVIQDRNNLFLSVITIGELQRGVELIRRRGDDKQARKLERWFFSILDRYADFVLDFDIEIARLWGHLRASPPHNALDKQIAATALIHDLTVATRNDKEFPPPAPVLSIRLMKLNRMKLITGPASFLDRAIGGILVYRLNM